MQENEGNPHPSYSVMITNLPVECEYLSSIFVENFNVWILQVYSGNHNPKNSGIVDYYGFTSLLEKCVFKYI